jgi:hypothetical protein
MSDRTSEHFDTLETRDPAARERALFQRLSGSDSRMP